ncbi:MAG: DUF6265 family protein [Flavobacterium sp.]
MKKITLFAAVFALLASCTKKETTTEETTAPVAEAPNKMAKAEWLLGSWGNTTPEGALTEKWEKVNDSVMHGESYFVIGGKDTLFAETVALTSENGKLAYTVTVPGQNDEKPVRFDMTSSNESQIVFENPQHDFPNKIVYKKITNDSLVAEISGMKKGKPASEQFAMKKQ